MGRKPLSYVDAATLLGGDSRAFAALSRIAGAGHSSGDTQSRFGKIDRTLFPQTDQWRGLLVLRDTLHPRQVPDNGELVKLLFKDFVVKGTSVAEVAIWTGMAQRGLPVKAPRRLANREQAEILRRIAPDFVARTRQLAAERGYPDPLPRELCRSGRHAASSSVRSGQPTLTTELSLPNGLGSYQSACQAFSQRSPSSRYRNR